MEKEKIKKIVRDGYAKIAEGKNSCSCCGGASAKAISKKIGYTDRDMESVPDGANLGLGCGNPVALASLKKGETVVDLGAGAGFDCFLAAARVGKTGKVIGVDMTPEMVAKASKNASAGGHKNVEFRLGDIEKLPVSDNAADIVISNCVINLSPDKEKVFREAFRVLKPGGRIMVSDMVWLRECPDFVKNSVSAYVGCISGAISKDKYMDAVRKAGFVEVKIIDEAALPADSAPNDPAVKAVVKDLEFPPETIEEIMGSMASIKVFGIKPQPVPHPRS